jgi:integrase/recombinase XerD
VTRFLTGSPTLFSRPALPCLGTLLLARRRSVAAAPMESIMITLKNWRERTSEDMRLRDFRPRTREAYLLATRQFIDHVAKEPESISDDDLRNYFLYLREKKKLAPSSINVALNGIRFFFHHTLRHKWPALDLVRAHKTHMLPVVLSQAEVRTILRAIRHPVRRTALATIYALGLRLTEGLGLQTGDIDGERLMVWVRDGKGARDRGVPLPRPVLATLRRYWKTYRPRSATKYLFVPPDGVLPLHPTTLQKTFSATCEEIHLEKHASIHTLRHSYATHLLEAGVSLRTIQQVLGHTSMRTTEVYMHVTQPGVDRMQEVLDRLMADL